MPDLHRHAGDIGAVMLERELDDDVERLVQTEQRARDERQQHDQRDERFFHALSIAASTARNPCASPPTGRPGRFTSFHAYTSKCAHGMSRGTK